MTHPDGTEEACNLGSSEHPSSHHIHFAMHYADLKREMRPIKSGVRLALSFSICFRGKVGPVPSLESAMESINVFHRAAEQYANEELFWPLSQKYTEGILMNKGLSGLQGPDRSLVSRISKAREALPPGKRFDILLVIAYKEEHIDGDEFETKSRTKNWSMAVLDLDGVRLKCFRVHHGHVDWQIDHTPDREKQYEDGLKIVVYWKSLLLIVPEMSCSIPELTKRYGPEGALQYLGNQHQSNPTSEAVDQAFGILEKHRESYRLAEQLNKILHAAVLLKDANFARSVWLQKPPLKLNYHGLEHFFCFLTCKNSSVCSIQAITWRVRKQLLSSFKDPLILEKD